MREIIHMICAQLAGSDYEDLTIKEKNIVGILRGHDYLRVNDIHGIRTVQCFEKSRKA